MITGSETKEILEYAFIDRCGEGFGWVSPEDGEQFWGHPYGFHSDNSEPFIDVVKNGVVVRSVNCSDLSEIKFKV